uniref:Uncharacterized protein n=1 Tax=Bionectria ochroleuca TaxID=29856 RepID=A0A8H7NJW8_BIOOC
MRMCEAMSSTRIHATGVYVGDDGGGLYYFAKRDGGEDAERETPSIDEAAMYQRRQHGTLSTNEHERRSADEHGRQRDGENWTSGRHGEWVVGLGCGGWDEMAFPGTVYLPHPMLYSKTCLRVEEHTRAGGGPAPRIEAESGR